MLVAVTGTTSVTTVSFSSGLGSPTIMRCCLRRLQLLCTCMAFLLWASVGTWSGALGSWPMFIWCFCFVLTFIILIIELCELEDRFSFSWDNFLTTYNCYPALLCLSASITYPITYIKFLPDSRSRDHAITSTAFSCIAFAAYAMEVAWTRAQPNTITSYMATVPGLLKGLETTMACVIFAFISSPHLYEHQPALGWCVAAYAICFLLAAVVLMLNLGKCENRMPIPFPIFEMGLTLLSVLLYASALVLWPLYQFDEKVGGQPPRSSNVSCSQEPIYSMCAWDQRLAVAILTAINLLIYVTDLVFLSLNFVKD